MEPSNQLHKTRPSFLKHALLGSVVISAICCVTFLVLIPASYSFKMPDLDEEGEVVPNDSISIGNFWIAAWGGDLWIFTNEMPYTGSIFRLEGTDRIDWEWSNDRYAIGQVSYIDQTGQSVGKILDADFPGIYYRHFEWKSSPGAWITLKINLFYPIALFAVLPCLWLLKTYKAYLKFSLRTMLMVMTSIALAAYLIKHI